MDRIKNFENEQFSGAKKAAYVPPKLEPVNDNSATVLLKEVSLLQKGFSEISPIHFQLIY